MWGEGGGVGVRRLIPIHYLAKNFIFCTCATIFWKNSVTCRTLTKMFLGFLCGNFLGFLCRNFHFSQVFGSTLGIWQSKETQKGDFRRVQRAQTTQISVE